MKLKNIKNKLIVGILPLLLILFTVSCANDDDAVQSFNITQLQSRITEAENLIANSFEGINAGDYQPGSKDDLQDVVDWIYWRIENSSAQANIDDAALKINAAIETFLNSTVSVAIPWVKQESGSMISISENIRPTLDGAFTIQGKFYIVDLNQVGYSNNLFANNQHNPGEGPRGFGIRYFGDGNVQILIGDDANWTDSSAGAGTFRSGEWLDIAFTNSGSEQKLYVNGQDVLTQTSNHTLANTNTLAIGNTPAWQDRVSNLLVKDFTVWDTVLDQATIQANSSAGFDGTEANLESYFPFGSNLGKSFSDVTGNYTATLVGAVEWVSEPPIIVVDYSALNTAIQKITDFIPTVEEGPLDGDFPVGTKDYLESVADAANDVVTNQENQKTVDAATKNIDDALSYTNGNKVADTDGVMIDLEDPSNIGYLIVPDYSPGSSSFTIEISTKLNSLMVGNNGDIAGELINNGAYLLRYHGESEAGGRSPEYGKLRFYVNNAADGSWNQIITPLAVMVPNIWINIAAVFDSSTGQQTIYINGVEVATGNFGVNTVSAGWGNTWLGNGWLKMNGSVKNVRIWSKALTQGELGADVVGSEADLETYFPLNRVAAKEALDETGNYTGIVRGSSWNKL